MAAAQKKFGTFAGVFTPSILTILGVIMYMRLGWVVGQAGLIATIGIILIAHIISISTGLSISSIATDKKIKTGGLYYMLSRSLGLPMGGAIGLTLFIGTALSISLYIIGFAESFLGIEEIQNFFNLSPDINSLRIIGSIVIVLLVLLAFISTSLAIKTQFFILAAIFISLISIGLGLFFNSSSGGSIHFNPIKDHEPLALIFAIFFPAVTGFTAGVAMSGDLKDPKKNIPKGTLFAIITGLIVYLSFAFALAFLVDPKILSENKHFLVSIAWSAPLVIAGIWGATLSSALGGILGGPRILQAMSKDKITPKLFARGYGVNKEPRNALIFTFIIAEAGILIGELDVIARIVSMFFIAAYGFINISYSLEKWASSDFRPSFKIPIAVGVIGFIACFFVMFSIDFIAMILAVVIIMLIYLFLKKRELQLDFGDVWHSVWASVVRTSLHKMDQKEIEERNWRPNILLFSKDNQQRPYLLEFGKCLVGKHGFLSNFELIENKSAEVLFPKSKQTVQSEESQNFKGVFTRKQSCRNFYEGVEMIAQTYGFSGIIPNTTLLGWSQKQKNPERFVKTLKSINDLDMNVLLMDYDYKHGFSKKESIDIWWRGNGNNGNLGLTLIRFLWLNDDWRNAHVRLMITNPINSEKEFIQQQAQNTLDTLRIDAEIRIVNNQVEKKDIFDLVRTESIQTDLILIGLPEIESGEEEKFVEDTNRLCEDVGTIIFIKASSYFKELKMGLRNQDENIKNEEENIVSLITVGNQNIPQLLYPENAVLKRRFRTFSDKYLNHRQHYFERTIEFSYNKYESFIVDIEDKTKSHLEKLSKNIIEVHNQEDSIGNYLYVYTNRMIKLNIQLQEQILPELHDRIKQGNSEFIKASNQNIADAPEIIYYRTKTKAGKTKTIKIYFRKLLQSYFPFFTEKHLFELEEKHRLISMQLLVEIQKFIKQLRIAHLEIAVKCNEHRIGISDIEEQSKSIFQMLDKLKEICKNAKTELSNSFLTQEIQTLQEISNILNNPAKIKYAYKSSRFKHKRRKASSVDLIPEIPAVLMQHQKLGANIILLQLTLLKIHLRLKNLFSEQSTETYNKIKISLEKHYDQAIKTLKKHLELREKGKDDSFTYESNDNILDEINQIHKIPEQIAYKLRPVLSKLPESISLMDSMTFNNYNEIGFTEAKSIKLSVFRLIDYIVQNEVLSPMNKSIGEYSIELGQSYSNIQNHLRFISFSSEIDDLGKDEYIFTLKEKLKELEKEKEQLQKINTHFNLQIGERMNTTTELLSVSKFIKTASSLKQYVKAQEHKKRKRVLSGRMISFRKRIRSVIDNYWYNQSKGLILAKKIRESVNDKNTRVNDLLNIYDQLKPNSEIIKSLPYYYAQLFSNKTHFVNDLWHGRKAELSQAEKTIKRHHAGYTGALLILGEYNSGKSFMSQYIAKKLYEASSVYLLTPPHEGSISSKSFLESLIKTMEMEGDIDSIFREIPNNSVVIIDDLELWWEKSPDGFAVIDIIIDLIVRYSQKHFFIVNANTKSFQLINKLKKIESYFLNIISCDPFDAAMLEKIIVQRHKSTNLKLKIRQKKHDSFRLISLPKFFARMFNFSKGNIGVSLNTWLANIYELDGNSISVSMPKQVDLHKLDYLGNDWYLLLMQFLLHKRLNLDKLKRITWEKSDVLFNKLMILKRAGLIIEDQNHVFELNPYMHMHIANKLSDKEMI